MFRNIFIAAAMAIQNARNTLRDDLLEAQGSLGYSRPKSRGKGLGKTSPSKHKVAMDKRAAVKARNRARHRAASR